MSINRALGEPLARGRTAEVYSLSETRVIKLFHRWMDKAAVEREKRNAEVAHALGLPVPAVGEIVRHMARTGIVFERVEGPSAMDLLTLDPDVVQASAYALADLHLSLHRIHAPEGLPRQVEILENRIAGCERLSHALRRTLLTRLREMPPEDRLCHGDFHPGNILQTARGPVIIDWIDASRGCAMADVARSSLLFRGHIETADVACEVRDAMQRYHTAYMARYLQAGAVDPAHYDIWFPIIAAARLREGIREQQDWLLDQVRAE